MGRDREPRLKIQLSRGDKFMAETNAPKVLLVFYYFRRSAVFGEVARSDLWKLIKIITRAPAVIKWATEKNSSRGNAPGEMAILFYINFYGHLMASLCNISLSYSIKRPRPPRKNDLKIYFVTSEAVAAVKALKADDADYKKVIFLI